jgi:hypothetical protein
MFENFLQTFPNDYALSYGLAHIIEFGHERTRNFCRRPRKRHLR